jgi:hypothetical protein
MFNLDLQLIAFEVTFGIGWDRAVGDNKFDDPEPLVAPEG